MEDEPNHDISIALDEPRYGRIAPALQRVVSAVLRRHDIGSASISLAIVNDDTIARLNEQHLNHKGPTDVLTFNLGESFSESASREAHPEPHGSAYGSASEADGRNAHVDGEIVMSWETALREAEQRGHSVESELALYAVHGALHLLGYDDSNKESAERMHAMEDDILSSLGFGRIYAANEQTHSPPEHNTSSAVS